MLKSLSPPQGGRSVPRFGALLSDEGIRFCVWSGAATRVWVSLFDAKGSVESARLAMEPQGEGVHALFVPGLVAGQRYGFRADGDYAPDRGLWFDPDKLLVDPYAVEIDRPYAYDARLAARRGEGGDTAALMPKAIQHITKPDSADAAPAWRGNEATTPAWLQGWCMPWPMA